MVIVLAVLSLVFIFGAIGFLMSPVLWLLLEYPRLIEEHSPRLGKVSWVSRYLFGLAIVPGALAGMLDESFAIPVFGGSMCIGFAGIVFTMAAGMILFREQLVDALKGFAVLFVCGIGCAAAAAGLIWLLQTVNEKQRGQQQAAQVRTPAVTAPRPVAGWLGQPTGA